MLVSFWGRVDEGGIKPMREVQMMVKKVVEFGHVVCACRMVWKVGW